VHNATTIGAMPEGYHPQKEHFIVKIIFFFLQPKMVSVSRENVVWAHVGLKIRT
jgi:hypothetical protein